MTEGLGFAIEASWGVAGRLGLLLFPAIQGNQYRPLLCKLLTQPQCPGRQQSRHKKGYSQDIGSVQVNAAFHNVDILHEQWRSTRDFTGTLPKSALRLMALPFHSQTHSHSQTGCDTDHPEPECSGKSRGTASKVAARKLIRDCMCYA